jgi:hypothetical protein
MGRDLPDHPGHGFRQRRLRGGNAKSLSQHFALFHIHQPTFDSTAANIDAEDCHEETLNAFYAMRQGRTWIRRLARQEGFEEALPPERIFAW